MTDPLVLESTTAQVRTLTLNRPSALNAFTSEMHGQLMAALEAAAADPDVRAVVLTGAGRGFCAGQDLADPSVAPEPGREPKDLGDAITRHYEPLVRRLTTMPVPVIAAVNGVAAGAGASVALLCDIVIAGRSASFIQAFSKIGLIPDTGGTWLLPRLVGRARALGLMMLAERLPAEEAERIGLIWRCVDDAQLVNEAGAIAERLAAMPSRALAATRAAVDDSDRLTLDEAVAAEARLQRELGRSADYLEGVAAFGERRPPRFTDR